MITCHCISVHNLILKSIKWIKYQTHDQKIDNFKSFKSKPWGGLHSVIVGRLIK